MITQRLPRVEGRAELPRAQDDQHLLGLLKQVGLESGSVCGFCTLTLDMRDLVRDLRQALGGPSTQGIWAALAELLLSSPWRKGWVTMLFDLSTCSRATL